ncbi:ABC transporter permease subunit [Micromonospora sp. LOL_023]|uniref:ABC transporter permease subunit n=1 Tax=Micromonospora sp. LOL_023 TaxID=3345418 RepID=UPI003A8A2AE0
MLLSDPFTKALRDTSRSMLTWAVAITAVGTMYASFWPTMQSPEMIEAMAAYPEGMLEAFNFSDVTSPAGYLGSAVFGLLIPLLVAVFGITAGARSIAGDEEAGSLDLLLAHPVGRAKAALQRFAAVAVWLALTGALLWLALVAIRGPAEFTAVGVGDLAAMSLHLVLFGMAFAALAYGVGAATGSRATALGVGAVVAVLGYLANAVLPQVEALAWTRDISPFHWYLAGDPLVDGVQMSGVLLLVGFAAVLVSAGTWRFTQRDIAV